MQIKAEARISEYDDGILGLERMGFAKANQILRVAVYVASDVNHSEQSPFCLDASEIQTINQITHQYCPLYLFFYVFRPFLRIALYIVATLIEA